MAIAERYDYRVCVFHKCQGWWTQVPADPLSPTSLNNLFFLIYPSPNLFFKNLSINKPKIIIFKCEKWPIGTRICYPCFTWFPNRQIFALLHRQIHESRLFLVTRSDSCSLKSTGAVGVELSILYTVAGQTYASKRNVKPVLGEQLSTICQLLNEKCGGHIMLKHYKYWLNQITLTDIDWIRVHSLVPCAERGDSTFFINRLFRGWIWFHMYEAYNIQTNPASAHIKTYATYPNAHQRPFFVKICVAKIDNFLIGRIVCRKDFTRENNLFSCVEALL